MVSVIAKYVRNRRQHAGLTTTVFEDWLSLVEWMTPALLCHKEKAHGLWNANLLASRWFFMAQGIGGFHARKGPIIVALMP